MSEAQTKVTLLDSLFRGDDSKMAVVIPEGGPKITYGELRAEIANASTHFEDQSGNCIILVLPNCLELLTLFFAASSQGAFVLLLNPALTFEELKFYMEDTHATAVIVPTDSKTDSPAVQAANSLKIPLWNTSLDGNHVVLPAKERIPNGHVKPPVDIDIALFCHTSGTTGKPKGVPVSHLNINSSAQNIIETYRLTPSDTSLLVMPLFHVHGLIGVALSTLFSGGTLVVPIRFSASSFWKLAAEYKVTWYSAVPTIHQILLARADQDGAPNGQLRFIRSCSSPLAPVILERLEHRFGAPVLEAYGMSEAAHQMSSNPLPPLPRKPGTVGKGTHVEIAILDLDGKPVPQGHEGEVCTKGKNIIKGYYKNPAANKDNWTSDGWFRTGDEGFLDANGYLTLTGRIKELINRGGEKISPVELDAVILEHEGVSEAVSFAVKDEKYGEEVAAVVVLKPEYRSKPASEMEQLLQAYCKKRLAEFKVPKKFYFTEAVPKSATGKIQRRNFASIFAGQK